MRAIITSLIVLMTATNMSGQSLPESAHPYANNFDYTWTYTHPTTATSLNVTFDAQTKVENGYDKICVMTSNGTNIAGSPFTSTSLASQTKTVTGSGFKIRLNSDATVTYWGFKVSSVSAVGSTPTPPPAAPIGTARISSPVYQRLRLHLDVHARYCCVDLERGV